MCAIFWLTYTYKNVKDIVISITFDIAITAMPKVQFKIGLKNTVTADASDSVLEFHFLDSIADTTYFDWNSLSYETESLVSQVMDQLNSYKPKKILLKIDSWGGDADAGKGVYNVIKSYPAKVEVDIVNKAGSAATVIACSGSKIRMPKTGMYVIHQAQNYAEGTAKQLREAADVADLYTDTYCEIYSAENRKGKTKADMLVLIADGDYWMTGQQAWEMGFVDEVYNSDNVTVSANILAAKAMYGDKMPPSLVKMCAAAEVAPENNDSILSKIENAMKNFGEMVTAAMGKLGTTKITAKVGDDMSADITAAIQPVLADLAANMQTEVTAEVNKIKDEVTASFEEKYGTVITGLQKKIDDLEADVTASAGTETAGKKDPKAEVVTKTFGHGVGGRK